MKSSRYSGLWLVVAAMCLAGCGRQQIERVEWPVMGTIAAVQTRGFASPEKEALWVRGLGHPVFGIVELSLNAHNPKSELSRIASCSDEKVCESCNSDMRPCYEAAFTLQKASDGAFNPRWRGTNTLDLGAIAKGFAVARLESTLKAARPVRTDCLIDLGGNLKALRGSWRTGVRRICRGRRTSRGRGACDERDLLPRQPHLRRPHGSRSLQRRRVSDGSLQFRDVGRRPFHDIIRAWSGRGKEIPRRKGRETYRRGEDRRPLDTFRRSADQT